MAIIENRYKTYNKRSAYKTKASLLNFQLVPNFLVLVFVFAIILNPTFFPLEKHLINLQGFAADKIVNPVVSSLKQSAQFVVNLINFESLHFKNLQLRLENEKLKQKVMILDSVIIENSNLKKLSNIIGDRSNMPRAKLISYSRVSGNFGIVGAGHDDGIQVGNIIMYNGNLVGRVASLSPKYAKVQLASHFSSRIAVKSTNHDLKAIIVGSSNNKVILKHIHGTQKPFVGQVLSTSGDGKYYPANIPVAVIDTVEGNNIVAKLLVDLSNVEYVDILSLDGNH